MLFEKLTDHAFGFSVLDELARILLVLFWVLLVILDAMLVLPGEGFQFFVFLGDLRPDFGDWKWVLQKLVLEICISVRAVAGDGVDLGFEGEGDLIQFINLLAESHNLVRLVSHLPVLSELATTITRSGVRELVVGRRE